MAAGTKEQQAVHGTNSHCSTQEHSSNGSIFSVCLGDMSHLSFDIGHIKLFCVAVVAVVIGVVALICSAMPTEEQWSDSVTQWITFNTIPFHSISVALHLAHCVFDIKCSMTILKYFCNCEIAFAVYDRTHAIRAQNPIKRIHRATPIPTFVKRNIVFCSLSLTLDSAAGTWYQAE